MTRFISVEFLGTGRAGAEIDEIDTCRCINTSTRSRPTGALSITGDLPTDSRRPIVCTDRPELGRRPADRRAFACRMFVGRSDPAKGREPGRRGPAARRRRNSIQSLEASSSASVGLLCLLTIEN